MEFINAKKSIRFTLILFAFLVSSGIGAQNISRAILLKNLSDSNELKTICVSQDDNIFSAKATINSNDFSANTEFALQLSNPDGNFGSQTLILSRTAANGNDINFENFVIPRNDGTGNLTASETYYLRVIVENSNIRPGTVSQNNALSIFYYDRNIQYSLMPFEGFCTLADAQLTADNDLDTYLWYKVSGNGNPDQLLSNVTGKTFKPTEVGSYYFRPNLGGVCSDIDGAQSNFVTVQDITNTITVTITAEGPTKICASERVVLTSKIDDPDPSSYNYQWTRDGIRLAGQTSTSIEVMGIEAEGNYNVLVSQNTNILNDRCAFTADNPIFVDLRNPTIKITSDLTIVDIPGEDEILTAELGETPQGSQVITWIKDGAEIPNSNTTNFTATGPGTYKVKVADANSPCTIKEMTSLEEVTVAPVDNLDVVIRYDNPAYTDCNFNQIALVASATSRVNGNDVPVNIENLDIEWLKNGADTGRSGSSIFINTASDNGIYNAIVNGFESNDLSVVLSVASLTLNASPAQLTLGGTSELSVNLPDNAILSDYTFQWQRGVAVPLPGETQPIYTVTNPGTYSVLVSFTGCGQTLVGPISLESGSRVIPNVLSRNTDGINNNWVLPALIKNNPEFSVEIYTANGQLDYKSGPEGYENQWPEESQSNLNGTIYYYVISKNDTVLEKGSITIIR